MIETKTDKLTLALPSRQIPSIHSSTSTRHELKLVSILLKAGGANIHEASVSVSTIHRQRRSSVTSKASEIRENIKGFSSIDITNSFIVIVFETTCSNTGRRKGSITRFQKMFNWTLFWLACRHHIPELFIKHANIAVRGPTKGLTDSLFKDIKEKFHFINLEDKMLWKWPTRAADWRRQKAREVLIWAEKHMERN